MKKILSLLALVLMSCMGAWAAFTPSTVSAPVKYTITNKNDMGLTSRLTYLGFDTEGAGPGMFIFIEQSGANQYKIYETTTGKYIGLKSGSGTQMKDCTRLVEDEANAETFTITATGSYYLISPTSLSATYLNFYQGAGSNKGGETVGFYTDGAGDNGSCWKFEAPQIVPGEVYRMKLRNGQNPTNYNFLWNATTNKVETRTSTNADSFVPERLFFFKWQNGGYTLHCVASGETAGITIPAQNNAKGSMTNTPTVFTKVTNNKGGFSLQYPTQIGNMNAHVNDVESILGIWAYGTSSQNDYGSMFTITAITDAEIDATSASDELKAAAKATHNYASVAALFDRWSIAENVYNTLYEGCTFGEGNGKYSIEGMSKDDIDEYKNAQAIGVNLKLDYDNDVANMLTMFAKRSLNMPVANTFIRMKSNVGNRYITIPESHATGTAVKTVSQASTDNIFYYTENKLLAYATGLYLNGDNHAVLGNSSTVAFTEAITGTKGVYAIKPSGNHWYDGGEGQDINHWGGGNNENCEWVLEEVTELPVTLPASGITTFYAPVDMQVNGDVNVYVGSIDEEETTITYTKLADKKIPAGTGVLIKGTPSANITISPIDEEVDEQTSCLIGHEYTVACEQTDDTHGENFIYTLQSGVFKYYTGSKLTGFKAHLELKNDHREVSGNSPLRIVFEDEFLTGIDAIAIDNNKFIFDLQGRRVNNAQKGIYIMNGKKVMR